MRNIFILMNFENVKFIKHIFNHPNEPSSKHLGEVSTFPIPFPVILTFELIYTPAACGLSSEALWEGIGKQGCFHSTSHPQTGQWDKSSPSCSCWGHMLLHQGTLVILHYAVSWYSNFVTQIFME